MPITYSLLAILALLTACSDPPTPLAPNLSPSADAGLDQSVVIGTQVNLNGTLSSDPEDATLTFIWTAASDNPIHIETPESSQFTFIPENPGTYLFVLHVNDGNTTSDPDSVIIIVNDSPNQPPTAKAGPDLIYPLNTPVILDGSASSDPEGENLLFLWEVIEASSIINLVEETNSISSFTATSSGVYRFRLTVRDGTHSISDEITIIIENPTNRLPIAVAGDDQQVKIGTVVTLNGKDSTDPEGLLLEYSWNIGQTPGATPILAAADTPHPTFTPELAGDYFFALVVFDGEYYSLQDLVTIHVISDIFNEASNMIEIPAGLFTMGSDKGAPDEQPPHEVELSLYWIDKFEVTAGAYQNCVSAGSCTPAAQVPGCTMGIDSLENHPINCITWSQANIFCQWLEKRLPTEAEWEKAARGTDGRRFPWGETFPSPDLLNYRSILKGTTAIGTYESGISFYGIHNMGGNVAEWTADYYGADYYKNSPSQDPSGPASGNFRVGRGANWQIGIPSEALTTTVRNRFNPETSSNTIGFRCASTAVK